MTRFAPAGTAVIPQRGKASRVGPASPGYALVGFSRTLSGASDGADQTTSPAKADWSPGGLAQPSWRRFQDMQAALVWRLLLRAWNRLILRGRRPGQVQTGRRFSVAQVAEGLAWDRPRSATKFREAHYDRSLSPFAWTTANIYFDLRHSEPTHPGGSWNKYGSRLAHCALKMVMKLLSSARTFIAALYGWCGCITRVALAISSCGPGRAKSGSTSMAPIGWIGRDGLRWIVRMALSGRAISVKRRLIVFGYE